MLDNGVVFISYLRAADSTFFWAHVCESKIFRKYQHLYDLRVLTSDLGVLTIFSYSLQQAACMNAVYGAGTGSSQILPFCHEITPTRKFCLKISS